MMKMLGKILTILSILGLSHAGYSQSAAPSTSQNLAAALATAALPKDRILIIVAAETVPLPSESTMPPNGSSLTTVTDTYQRIVRAFGAVTAIAPPTMFVLNTHPGNPDLYAGLPSQDAFQLLVASLDNVQWRALTSQSGLGLTDLSSDDQREMFQAIFTKGVLKVGMTDPNADQAASQKDLSSEIPEVHLRLRQKVQLSLAWKGHPNGYTGSNSKETFVYYWVQGQVSPDPLFGVPQSTEVPNALKVGQLDWNLPVLRSMIPLDGLKTVRGLIARVGQVTHLELYADKRYEDKSLRILGEENGSAPAADVLRALAFCLTGAFRQVGPAYVLTQDVIGTEAQRMPLRRFAQFTDRSRTELISKSSNQLGKNRSLRDLTEFDDPIALSADEQKQISYDDIGWPEMKLPMGQLTAAQQENVREQVASLVQMAQDSPNVDIPVPDLNGNVQLQVHADLEFLIPSLSSPVKTSLTPDLYHAATRSDASNAPNSPKPLSEAMALTSNRAISVRPASAAELTADIAAMKRLGFNQLWLDVFSQGHLLTPLPDGADLLTLALRLTRGTNIRVYVVMDLFQWGTDAPSEAIDLDASGRTSAQAEADIQQEKFAEATSTGIPMPPLKPISGLSVTPFSPVVLQQLMALVKHMAQQPGLAGFVWCHPAPGGYTNGIDSISSDSQPDLGYTVASRLAFLRQEHTDPIDISKTRVMGERGSTIGVSDLPGMSIPDFNSLPEDVHLSMAWDKVRMDTDVHFVQSLYQAAGGAQKTHPVFLSETHGDYSPDWYGSWDSPTAPLKAAVKSRLVVPSFMHHSTEAKPPQTSIVELTADDAHSLSDLATVLEDTLKDNEWDGFVWNITQLKPSVLSALEQPTPTK